MRSPEPTSGSKRKLKKVRITDEEIDLLLHCQKDPIFWFEHCVRTQDQHDRGISAKPFPRYLDAKYIYQYIDVLMNDNRILVEKSRQLMWSWTTVAFMLWCAQFYKNEAVYFISQMQLKANQLIKRAKFIYNHQFMPTTFSRPAMETIHTVTYSHRDIGTQSLIPFFPPRHEVEELGRHHQQSWLQALSEDADNIRMETASRVFFDEMAFMQNAEEACQAIWPALGETGQLVGVSTPNGPCYFYRLIYDLEGEDVV